jgi:hypothetical protein
MDHPCGLSKNSARFAVGKGAWESVEQLIALTYQALYEVQA